MKLVMDLAAAMPLRGDMNDDRRDLLIRLCTEAGIIMEDMSPVALMIGSRGVDIPARLAELDAAIAEMAALISAAKVMSGLTCEGESPEPKSS